ncbi:MAG: YdcF family protein [Cyanobacteria bacterium J06639_14]
MPALTDIWTTFTWTLFHWLSEPKLFVPIGLGITLGVFVTKLPAWMKPLRRILPVLLASYFVLATPGAASLLIKGLTVILPPGTDQSVDAIVVLSRNDDLGYSRYTLALQLWRENRAPKIFVTSFGRVGYMTDRLKREALPMKILDGTACARTTYEEASSAAVLLRPQNVERIILITDPPHLLRSVLTFRAFGFEVFPQVASFHAELPAVQKSLLALREYFGLVSYAVLGRFSKQSLDKTSFAGDRTQPSECVIKWLDRSPKVS